jgi:tripartite ATP-independent transporter DctM subunit
MTPTEASAVAAAYALLIGVCVYHSLSLEAFGKVLINTLRTTGVIFLVIVGAYGFSFIIASEQVDKAVFKLISGLITSPWEFLLIANIVFLILGCFVDVNVSELVFLPMIMPLVHYFHIDPVHFGVMVCLNMMIGLLTPPFGMLLFITAGIGKTPLKDIIRETVPFLIVELVALVIITYIPSTVLFLTHLVK